MRLFAVAEAGRGARRGSEWISHSDSKSKEFFHAEALTHPLPRGGTGRVQGNADSRKIFKIWLLRKRKGVSSRSRLKSPCLTLKLFPGTEHPA